MKRIYLDQNKWVDLARAAQGLPQGKRFTDVLLILRQGVSESRISLPLSAARYTETHARREWRSRRQLGETMLEFSRLHAMAPQSALVPGEIDRALNAQFGRPQDVRPVQPFGTGAGFALAREIPPYRIPLALRVSVPDPETFERRANQLQEKVLLLGMEPAQEAAIPGFEPLTYLEVGEKYAKGKEELRRLRKEAGWHKGERAARLAKAQTFSDFQEVIEEAMSRAGLHKELLSLGQAGMSAFPEAVPTMHVMSELERHRETASEKEWERQDLSDLGSLSVAFAHCDIVVTEKFWVDVAGRSKFGEKFQTIILRHLDELPKYLVAD
jgi:hypothetical protein